MLICTTVLKAGYLATVLCGFHFCCLLCPTRGRGDSPIETAQPEDAEEGGASSASKCPCSFFCFVLF